MAIATSFTFGTRMKGDLPSVRPVVEAALRAEGFGVADRDRHQGDDAEQAGDRAATLRDPRSLQPSTCSPGARSRSVRGRAAPLQRRPPPRRHGHHRRGDGSDGHPRYRRLAGDPAGGRGGEGPPSTRDRDAGPAVIGRSLPVGCPAAAVLATIDRRFAVHAVLWTAASVVAFGLVAAIIPNPVFGRQIPVEPFAIAVWLIAAPFMGLLGATYTAPGPIAPAESAPFVLGPRHGCRRTRWDDLRGDGEPRRIPGDRLPSVQQDRPGPPRHQRCHDHLRAAPARHRSGLAHPPCRHAGVASSIARARGDLPPMNGRTRAGDHIDRIRRRSPSRLAQEPHAPGRPTGPTRAPRYGTSR